MSVTLRPGTREDFLALLGEAPEHRCKVVVAEDAGQVIAIGGLVYRPDGVFASVKLTEAMRKHPVTLHRAVLRGLAEARRAGVREILAVAEPGNAAADPWLQRLGFKRMQTRAGTAWVWRDRTG